MNSDETSLDYWSKFVKDSVVNVVITTEELKRKRNRDVRLIDLKIISDYSLTIPVQ